MISRVLARSARPALQSATRQQQRAFAITTVKMAEGDVGAPKSGGVAQGDAFNKREQADENYYVKQREREKLASLKDKIAEQQKHLKELEAHVDELSSSGGEKK